MEEVITSINYGPTLGVLSNAGQSSPPNRYNHSVLQEF